MIALCRYQLADFLRSQRWVPPLLAYLIVLGLVYSLDAGPSVPAYGVTAVAVFPIAGVHPSPRCAQKSFSIHRSRPARPAHRIISGNGCDRRP